MREHRGKACATRVPHAGAANSPAPRARVHRVLCIVAEGLSSPQGKKRGTRRTDPSSSRADGGAGYALVAGLTPGLSLKNCLFSSM
jgi:hypothetical protein